MVNGRLSGAFPGGAGVGSGWVTVGVEVDGLEIVERDRGGGEEGVIR